MEEGGLARVGCLVSFALRGDGGADLGEGGSEVIRGVNEDGAGVADGDAYELDAAPLFTKGGEQGEVFVGLLGVFLVAAKVLAEANLEKDEGAIISVEGVEVGGWVGWYSSCVNDVGGGTRSCRNLAVEVFLWEGPSRNVPGGHHAFFVVHRCCPICGESLRVYGHVDSAIHFRRLSGKRYVIEPICG